IVVTSACCARRGPGCRSNLEAANDNFSASVGHSYPAAVLHRRLTAPQARREIDHHFGGAQCSIIGPISLIRMGIFRMQSIWNAPTTNKQRNALRNSYLTAMPSFGRRIGLLRSTPRERAHSRHLVISSVSGPPRPRAEDCVEGLNRLIFGERFMGCVGGVKSLKDAQFCLCVAPLGRRALAKL